MLRTNIRKLALHTMAVVLCNAGQVAFAHTGIMDSPTEGQTSYNAFTITHACNNNAGTLKTLPVVAQSAVFPNNTDSEAFKIDPVTKDETPIDLEDYIIGAIGGSNLDPKMIAGSPIFKTQSLITDGTGKVRGLAFLKGKLDPSAIGVVEFRAKAPTFTEYLDAEETMPNCAKSLKVRIAIANYCGKKDANRADIWIGHMTSLFNDPEVMPHDFETSPFWPTMTVLRSGALDESCGDGFDIAVQPSDDDIDNYLPIKGFWPFQ